MTNKKKIITTIVSALITAIGLGVWNATSTVITEVTAHSVKKVLNNDINININQLDKNMFYQELSKNNLEGKIAIKLTDELFEKKDTIKLTCEFQEAEEECIERNKSNIYKYIGFDKLKNELIEFNRTYASCREYIINNSHIDPTATDIFFPKHIQCLLHNGQKNILEKLSKTDPYIADIINQQQQHQIMK